MENLILDTTNDFEDTLVTCPKCGSEDIGHAHKDASYLADEVDYFICCECGYQWGES